MLTSSVREWTGVGGRTRKDLSLSLGHSGLLNLDPSQIPHGIVELFRLRLQCRSGWSYCSVRR